MVTQSIQLPLSVQAEGAVDLGHCSTGCDHCLQASYFSGIKSVWVQP